MSGYEPLALGILMNIWARVESRDSDSVFVLIMCLLLRLAGAAFMLSPFIGGNS